MKITNETERTLFSVDNIFWFKFYIGCFISHGWEIDVAIKKAHEVMEKLK